MLVTRNLQPSLWESVLPAEVRRMAPLLEQVDRWLDDEAFFAPFREHFSVMFGRPSIPMEVYLRMMFLKFQYKLGYESLCRALLHCLIVGRVGPVPGLIRSPWTTR